MKKIKDYPLFVYGTLRPGASHYHLVEQEVSLRRKARVNGRLYRYSSGEWDGWFPYLTKEEGIVYGDLLYFQHTEEVLAISDDFEDNGGLYQRELYSAYTEDGVEHTAWVYFIMDGMEGDNEWIVEGDWLNVM
ncbi:MAG: gamma-glutamylcyclotransferase [Spirochaetota bacterium]|nr:gamma-glutamylcyclotransferase [Spirochaetota bacterium]